LLLGANASAEVQQPFAHERVQVSSQDNGLQLIESASPGLQNNGAASVGYATTNVARTPSTESGQAVPVRCMPFPVTRLDDRTSHST